MLRAGIRSVAEILLAPFTVFAKIITAERLVPDALGWAALGAILVVGIYALAIRLDANYLETAVRVSRQMQERKRACRERRHFRPAIQRDVRSSRLPQPPWLGGVGPLVWRQVIQALRGSRGAHDAGRDCGGGHGRSVGLWAHAEHAIADVPAAHRSSALRPM